MEMRVNAVTTEGEKVVIVSKEITDGARPFESQILTSEDGRTFKPAGGGQVMEITIMDDRARALDELTALGEEEERMALAADLGTVPPTVVEVPVPDAEQAAEAPAADEDGEADSQV